MNTFRSFTSLTAAVAAAALLSACGSQVRNPVTGQKERTVMSESAEIAEGRKAHAEILKEMPPLANPAIQAYVNDLGQRLAKQSHKADITWTFTVIDSPDVNAFALPGGFVYVTRGIMAHMDSEADLAGVIGHEIGHVTARHGAQRATRQQNAALGAVAAGILGMVLDSKGYGQLGQAASQVGQQAAAGYVAKYSREQELQADGLGAEYLVRANFDPRNMVDVIGVLKNQERFAQDQARAEGRPVPEGNSWLASHPSNDQRLDAITKLAAQYKADRAYVDEGRDRFLRLMNGVRYGESPDQGLTRGNQFYHPTLNFAMTAPAGWRFINEADQLIVVNGRGDAALVMQVAPEKAGRTHDEVLRNYVKPDSGRADRFNLNGLNASKFVGTRAVQGGRQPVDITLVTGPTGLIYILNAAGKDAQTVALNRNGLSQAEQSFRPMTAADTQAAKPWTIGLAAYPRGGFAELARSSPVPNGEQHLRLINGYYAGGEPKPGMLVKVVRQD
jgi:predicted Zn-dependent protease